MPQESFRQVFNEMSSNLPDSTTTIEEKQHAISYIDRMLACSDISNPEYWKNKKLIIEQEIVQIENSQKVGKNESVEEIWNEFASFASKYRVDRDFTEFSSVKEMQGTRYWQTYHLTCLSFYERLLEAFDATPQLIAIWKDEMESHKQTLRQL